VVSAKAEMDEKVVALGTAMEQPLAELMAVLDRPPKPVSRIAPASTDTDAPTGASAGAGAGGARSSGGAKFLKP
jgi:hypothetical protein